MARHAQDLFAVEGAFTSRTGINKGTTAFRNMINATHTATPAQA
jgi:hypothetical protein